MIKEDFIKEFTDLFLTENQDILPDDITEKKRLTILIKDRIREEWKDNNDPFQEEQRVLKLLKLKVEDYKSEFNRCNDLLQKYDN